MSSMSWEDAVSALEGAVESDAGTPAEPSLFAQPDEPTPAAPATPQVPAEQATADPAPQGESATDTGAAPVEPPVAPAAPTAVDTFDDGKFNPDTLPAELRPAWNQLQAAFTRKTQDVAEQRRQLEGLGISDFGQLTEAVQLHQQLQDPANWPQFQQEIATLMQQRGLTSAPVAPVATPAAPGVPATASSPTASELEVLAQTYPELAPLAHSVRSLEQRLEQTTGAFEAQQHALAVERQALAVQGEFSRQESLLRESGVTEKDMERIYSIAPSHNGNLLAANEAFQAMKTDVLSEYLATKTELQQTPVAPIGGSGVTSSTPQRATNLEQATDIAIETLRAAGYDNFDF